MGWKVNRNYGARSSFYGCARCILFTSWTDRSRKFIKQSFVRILLRGSVLFMEISGGSPEETRDGKEEGWSVRQREPSWTFSWERLKILSGHWPGKNSFYGWVVKSFSSISMTLNWIIKASFFSFFLSPQVGFSFPITCKSDETKFVYSFYSSKQNQSSIINYSKQYFSFFQQHY